jgi:hypothetical protein
MKQESKPRRLKTERVLEARSTDGLDGGATTFSSSASSSLPSSPFLAPPMLSPVPEIEESEFWDAYATGASSSASSSTLHLPSAMLSPAPESGRSEHWEENGETCETGLRHPDEYIYKHWHEEWSLEHDDLANDSLLIPMDAYGLCQNGGLLNDSAASSSTS